MKNARCFRPVFFAAIFALLLAMPQGMFASGKAASVPARITQQIDESKLVKLAGNTRPEANSRNDRGAVSDSFNIEHMFLLLQRSPRQEQKLDKLIDELNDKNSPNFHHWLTAETFGQRFGVAQQDIDTVTGWLQSHGFRVNQVYASQILIDFSGTAGQLRQAFHTEIHQLDVNGEQHISNISDPQIPAALAPVVKGIASLNDFKPHAMYKSKTQYTVAGCSDATFPTEPGTDCYFMTPQDTETIYNLNPLYNAGISGQGQTIVLVEDSDTYNGTGDWNTYRSTFGLASAFPLGTYTQVHPGCTDPGTNGDDGEAAIDVEVASAVAPSAAIELISCASGTVTFGGLIALQNLINEPGPYPGIVSVSYGVCEAFNGNGGNAAFYNTYQQAASEGISVFGASGDEGPSSCSADFSIGSEYDAASLGVSGWTDTPFNVAVGGTDFEDTYNVKEAGASFGTYWSATNSAGYGSALQYVPEIPWNDACASVLISEVVTGSFTPYGASPAICNNSSWDTSSTYLSTGAGSGGASNCATGSGGTDQGDYGVSDPQCQGYPKPSWQSVYGVPSDGVRDIPDVSMFAANGVWGHYEVVCWSDPAYTADGSASCTGAPSSWSGFGGTSVASPTMAAIQALVNQKTGENWGNPNPIYYQIAQNEYGTAGGTFIGSACNSSGNGGPGSGCAFNDITQGDIDLACTYNGSVEKAHCYLPAGTYGVDSTDNVTAATVINGGTGYTTAPACAIAGPTNNSPYLSPTGGTLWAGGTQAACTTAVNSGTTTAKWTVAIESTASVGDTIILTNPSGTTICGPYTLSGSSTTNEASGLVSAIGSACSLASATSSHGTVTITAKTAGYAGDFITEFGPATLFDAFYVYITNTTLGQGPNYVSAITITTAGSGYQPETPITLTGGGTGAIAVANTSIGTGAQSYQPAYGAAPGYDLATGLGSVNAYNLVEASAWLPTTSTAVSSSLNPSIYGQAVSFTATVTGNSPTGTVQFNIDGSPFGSAVTLALGSATSGSTSTLTVGTHTVTAVYSGDTNNQGSAGTLSGGQVVSQATAGTVVTSGTNPSAYGQSVTFTATISGEYGLLKGRGGRALAKGRAQDVSGTVLWSANTGCGTTPVTPGNPGVATCTTSSLPVGTDVITATYSGDSNHSGSTGTLSGGQVVNQVVSSTTVLSSLDPSTYGQAVSFTASVTGSSPTGTVQFNIDGSPFGSAVTLASGSATSGSISTLTAGTHTVTAVYSGDTDNQGSTGTLSGGQVVSQATAGTVVTSNQNPSTYGQSVTFTATINGEYGLIKGRKQTKGRAQDITGTVQWSANTGCGTTNVTTGNPGIATCTTSTLPVGTDTITGTYSGDSNHSGSTGTLSGGQQVNQAVSSTAVLSSMDPSAYGQAVSFTASVTGSSPTGTVQFNIDGSPFGSPVTLASGSATSGSISTLTAGTHTVTAVYSGDTNNQGSTGTLSGGQNVGQAASGTVVTSNVNPSAYGQSVTFTATISGEYGLIKGRKQTKGRAQDVSGTVAWSANTGCGTTTVTTGNPGVATCTTSSLPVGTDVITATYSGDSNHGGSMGTLSGGQQVLSGSSTAINVTSVSPASEAYGQDTTITITAVLSWSGSGVPPTASDVTISGNGNGTYGPTNCGAPSGDTITCTATYTPTAADNAGSYTETATFTGDSNYGGSSSTQNNNFTITQATSSTSVASSVNPSTYGQSVTFTATIDGEYGVIKGQNGAVLGRALVSRALASRATKGRAQDVSGTVQWSANTGCAPSTVTGNYPGTATCTTSSLPGGTDTITATYSGDSDHGGSTGTLSGGQVVNPATQTITFTKNAPSQAVYGTSFTVAASASSGLPITYSSAGSCSNVGPTYTMTSGTGTCTETASQPGNNDYQAASPVSESTTAERANQTVTFTGAPAKAPYNSTFVMTATSTDPSAVAYITNSNSSTCSLSGNYSPVTVTMLKSSGSCKFTASWGADQNYNPATATQTTAAEKATPVITWATPSPINYGTALSATQLDATANVAGTFTYNPAAGKIEPAGNDTLKVNFVPTSANYTTASYSVTLQVNQASTVTTITSPSQTITLNKSGTASATLDFNVASYEPTGSVTLTASTGETCSGTLTPASGDGKCKLTFNTTGTRTIIASYAGDSNHTGSNSSGQSPAITVTVNPF